MKLTKTEIERLEPKDKLYRKSDGGGLFIEVSPKGTKHWNLKYYFQGKERRVSLGKYPHVTLVKARAKRVEAKELLVSGIDPAEQRKEDQRIKQQDRNNTFGTIYEEWYEKQEDRWSYRRAKSVKQMAHKNLLPFLRDTPLNEITNSSLLQVLQKIENRGAYSATRRTNQICSQVFRYAIQVDRMNRNPADQLRGAFRSKRTEHFPAIQPNELPELLHSIYRNEARLFTTTRMAIFFSLYTFCRPGEIRQARWENICFEEKMWTIPAEYMKSRKDHLVPLSEQALGVLERQRRQVSSIVTPWVFPAQRKPLSPMSDATVNIALKKLGFHGRMTAHGFRALARTAIREKLKYFPDTIEAQLAHKPAGPFGAAYDRSQFIDERVKMMQEWADYIHNVSPKI